MVEGQIKTLLFMLRRWDGLNVIKGITSFVFERRKAGKKGALLPEEVRELFGKLVSKENAARLGLSPG